MIRRILMKERVAALEAIVIEMGHGQAPRMLDFAWRECYHHLWLLLLLLWLLYVIIIYCYCCYCSIAVSILAIFRNSNNDFILMIIAFVNRGLTLGTDQMAWSKWFIMVFWSAVTPFPDHEILMTKYDWVYKNINIYYIGEEKASSILKYFTVMEIHIICWSSILWPFSTLRHMAKLFRTLRH